MYSKVKSESNSFSVLEVCLCNLICSDVTHNDANVALTYRSDRKTTARKYNPRTL